MGFFCFYCYLAALFSSCQQLFFNPSSIYGHWVFPFPNLFQLWLLDPKEGITFGSSKCGLCYITAEGEALKGGHTESCETLATQLLLTVAQIIIKQFYSGSIRPFFILAFLTVTLL